MKDVTRMKQTIMHHTVARYIRHLLAETAIKLLINLNIEICFPLVQYTVEPVKIILMYTKCKMIKLFIFPIFQIIQYFGSITIIFADCPYDYWLRYLLSITAIKLLIWDLNIFPSCTRFFINCSVLYQLVMNTLKVLPIISNVL